jgi:hypothetical protein
MVEEKNRIYNEKFLKSNDPSDDYKQNPLWLKMKIQVVLMVLQYLIIFVVIPMMGNTGKHNTVFCNDIYGLIGVNGDCNYVPRNGWTWFYYVLYTLYFTLGAIQIKYGENFMKFQVERKWGMAEKIELIAFRKIPFIFPIKTALDWATTKTSLQLFDWFKYLDTQYMLLMAKYTEVARSKDKLGEPQPMIMKIGMGWALVAGLLG